MQASPWRSGAPNPCQEPLNPDSRPNCAISVVLRAMRVKKAANPLLTSGLQTSPPDAGPSSNPRRHVAPSNPFHAPTPPAQEPSKFKIVIVLYSYKSPSRFLWPCWQLPPGRLNAFCRRLQEKAALQRPTLHNPYEWEAQVYEVARVYRVAHQAARHWTTLNQHIS